MSLDKFREEFRELEDKAKKYDFRMSQDREKVSEARRAIEKIESGLDDLKQVLKFLDPLNSTEGKTRKTKGVKYNVIAEELYQLIQKGTEVHREFVENTYQLDTVTANNIMQRVQKLHNVDKRYEGRKVFLYAKH